MEIAKVFLKYFSNYEICPKSGDYDLSENNEFYANAVTIINILYKTKLEAFIWTRLLI